MTFDADHAVVFDQNLFDSEPFADLRTSLAAASTSSLSKTVRREQYATGASFVPGAPESVKGPKSNVYV